MTAEKILTTSRSRSLGIPISVQRSLLDFLFTQEEVQCGGNNVGVLAKLFR